MKSNWYVHIGNKIELSKIGPICNRNHNKPFGGLWASSVWDHLATVSAWDEAEQDMGLNKSREYCNVFQLDKQTRLCTIDSYQDLEKLMAHYKKTDKTVIFPGMTKTLAVLDFEKMAEDYDAILLTSRGQIETHYMLHNRYTLYGWDCESIIIFDKACIKHLESILYDTFLDLQIRTQYL